MHLIGNNRFQVKKDYAKMSQSFRLSLFILLIFAVALLSSGIRPASANTYLGTTQITCTDFTAAETGADNLDRDNTGTGQESVRIDVTDGYGTIVYSLSFTNVMGSYPGGLINTTPYDTAPKANPITVRVISLAGNGLKEQTQVIGVGECQGLPSTGGRSIPAGFVLKTMVCDVQGYSEPDPGRDTGARFLAGQTWYVNPVSVGGTDGRQWTEVFASGTTNVYVPTSCVK
jgi:hypothetical protein